MPLPSSIYDLSTSAASNSPAGVDSIGTSLDDYLRAIQAIIKQQFSTGTQLASGSTITPQADGNFINVTGTSSITGIASTNSWNGRIVVLKFSDALTLTHSANLVLPNAANITTATNDVFSFVQESTGVWRCISEPTSVSRALAVLSIDVGHASDTTLTRASAGTLAVEGVNLLTTATGAALAGSASQAFSVATATAAAHAVTKAQLDAVPTITFASSAENIAGTIENKAVDPLGIREAFNCTGSAPVFACRAWVNFNGSGTVAIRGSGNVSSITDNGTGDYTVNFTTAMPDASGYAAVGTGVQGAGLGTGALVFSSSTASAYRFVNRDANNAVTDGDHIAIAFFR